MPNYVIFVSLDLPNADPGDATEFELPNEDELNELFQEYGNSLFVYSELKQYHNIPGESKPRFGHVTYFSLRDANKVMENLQDHKFQNGVTLRLLRRPDQDEQVSNWEWRTTDWGYYDTSESEEEDEASESESENN